MVMILIRPTYPNQPADLAPTYLKMSKEKQDHPGWDIPRATPVFPP